MVARIWFEYMSARLTGIRVAGESPAGSKCYSQTFAASRETGTREGAGEASVAVRIVAMIEPKRTFF